MRTPSSTSVRQIILGALCGAALYVVVAFLGSVAAQYVGAVGLAWSAAVAVVIAGAVGMSVRRPLGGLASGLVVLGTLVATVATIGVPMFVLAGPVVRIVPLLAYGVASAEVPIAAAAVVAAALFSRRSRRTTAAASMSVPTEPG